MKRILIATALLGLCGTAGAQAQDDGAVCDGVVIDDPARLYDFKLGDWDIRWRNRTADGGFVEFDATGHVYLAMDGDVLIDEQTSDYFKGMTFRTYLPEAEEWVVRWLPANGRFDHPISARLEDCVPVERHRQLTPDGREVTVVTRFTGITPDSFSFSQAWSFDEGETWVEDVLHYDAVRSGSD